MSQDDPIAAPPGPRARSASTTAAATPPREPRRTGSGALTLAVLLALAAVGGAGYVGWQQWQQQQGNAATMRSAQGLQERVATLESTLKTLSDERSSLTQRLHDTDDVNRGMREELLGQNERLRNLEDAVTKLSESSLSGHDAMLLDEAESMLRMAGERYTLFHDAQGAAAAYGMADQAIGAVGDAAFSGLRQSIGAEREALLKSDTTNPQAALQQLEQLRNGIASWSLKPLDTAAAGQADSLWSRTGRALSSVVSIERDNGAPLAVADARFARELAALDLVQAQAALLAHDPGNYLDALTRVAGSLSVQFDPADDGVRQAQAAIASLLAQGQPKPPVQLGAALTELRNLRAVHALKPGAAANSVPAAASSAGGAKP
jgi:uroporphyrin-3 C-methyltransferase